MRLCYHCNQTLTVKQPLMMTTTTASPSSFLSAPQSPWLVSSDSFMSLGSNAPANDPPTQRHSTARADSHSTATVSSLTSITGRHRQAVSLTSVERLTSAARLTSATRQRHYKHRCVRALTLSTTYSASTSSEDMLICYITYALLSSNAFTDKTDRLSCVHGVALTLKRFCVSVDLLC